MRPADELRTLLAQIEQQGRRHIYIVGGPGSGKTTLANNILAFMHPGYAEIHADDYLSLPWDKQPEAVVGQFGIYDTFVAEGIGVSRALRKYPRRCPAGLVIVCTRDDGSSKPGRALLRERFANDLAEIKRGPVSHTYATYGASE